MLNCWFLAQLRGQPALCVLRTVLMVSLGLYSQYWLLIHISGFQSPITALFCMLVCRAMFSVPYIHVNIFQVRNTCRSVCVACRRATSSCFELDANKPCKHLYIDNENTKGCHNFIKHLLEERFISLAYQMLMCYSVTAASHFQGSNNVDLNICKCD